MQLIIWQASGPKHTGWVRHATLTGLHSRAIFSVDWSAHNGLIATGASDDAIRIFSEVRATISALCWPRFTNSRLAPSRATSIRTLARNIRSNSRNTKLTGPMSTAFAGIHDRTCSHRPATTTRSSSGVWSSCSNDRSLLSVLRVCVNVTSSTINHDSLGSYSLDCVMVGCEHFLEVDSGLLVHLLRCSLLHASSRWTIKDPWMPLV